MVQQAVNNRDFKKCLTFIVLISLHVLSGCNKRTGNRINVISGENFEIELSANPSIGAQNCYFASNSGKIKLLSMETKHC
jgi:hypothetical protein